MNQNFDKQVFRAVMIVLATLAALFILYKLSHVLTILFVLQILAKDLWNHRREKAWSDGDYDILLQTDEKEQGQEQDDKEESFLPNGSNSDKV